MPIGDFIARRTVVVIDGRRFVCRPPTVATVHRLLEAFPRLVHAVAKAVHLDGMTWDESAARDVLAAFVSSPALAGVLDTCCTLHGAAPGELVDLAAGRADVRGRLADAVFGLCDPARIVASLDLPAAVRRAEVAAKPGGDPAPADAPARIDTALCVAALRYHVTPLDVTEWPYEAFLSIDEVEAALASMAATAGRYGATGGSRGIDLTAPADELRAQGIAVLRPKKRG